MPQILPAALHRALLPLAHLARHHWRRWRKAPIAGVSVIITSLGGDVLLLKHSYGPDVWSLPGGGLGRGAGVVLQQVGQQGGGQRVARIAPVALADFRRIHPRHPQAQRRAPLRTHPQAVAIDHPQHHGAQQHLARGRPRA